jgi:hypothetical protein
MTLLIDTGMVAPQDRPEFWARCSWDVYHPLEIHTEASERFEHFPARQASYLGEQAA